MGTLQKLIGQGDEVTAYCYARGCDHSTHLDLLALKALIGDADGTPHDVIVPRLICKKCGSKNLGIRISPGAAIRPSGRG